MNIKPLSDRVAVKAMDKENIFTICFLAAILNSGIVFSQPSTAGRIVIGIKDGISTYYGDIMVWLIP